jgi:hypothetical protein
MARSEKPLQAGGGMQPSLQCVALLSQCQPSKGKAESMDFVDERGGPTHVSLTSETAALPSPSASEM